MVLLTFFTLIAGLIYTSKTEDDGNNKINKFMRYRVYIQFATILILILAIYAKKQITG